MYSGAATSSADAVASLLPSTSLQNRIYHYAAYGCASEAQCNLNPSTTTVILDLGQALRAGGYVVHWRHASADVCSDKLSLGTAQSTTSPNWWKSCDATCSTATARQLNAVGVTEATNIGSALRRRGVPFGRVLSSEYCRNVGTAELMNLGPTIEQIPEITFFVYDEVNRCANSQSLVSQPPAPGTNTALIGHAGFPSPCAVFGELGWAEAAVFKPNGSGGSELVARVSANQWEALSSLPTLTPTASATATATPSPTSTPQDSPTNLMAAVDGEVVRLSWVGADPASGFNQVRVVRRLNAPPQGPSDPLSSVVFFGSATSTSESLHGLLPSTAMTGRTYHYAAYACDATTCNPKSSLATLSLSLRQVLRAGGYVIHWRHAFATTCSDRTELGNAATTMSPSWWKSCDSDCNTATARQLSATGVEQATAIGNAVRAQAIPIGRLLVSEFCRTVTTAQLMNFGVNIEQRPDITFLVYNEASRCDASDALVSEAPAVGTNTGIVGHGFVTGDCQDLDSLAFGEAAIFKPDGSGGRILIEHIRDSGWAELQ